MDAELLGDLCDEAAGGQDFADGAALVAGRCGDRSVVSRRSAARTQEGRSVVPDGNGASAYRRRCADTERIDIVFRATG